MFLDPNDQWTTDFQICQTTRLISGTSTQIRRGTTRGNINGKLERRGFEGVSIIIADNQIGVYLAERP